MHTSMLAMQPFFGHNVYDTAYLIDVCVWFYTARIA